MSIPIVLVARNSLALTKKAIASCLNQDVAVEILVIENACTDGSAQWFNAKPVAVINTGEQWALAKCWNVALKALWKAGWDRALVINNDVVLPKSCCRVLDAVNLPFVTCVSVNSEEQFDINANPDIETLRAGARPNPDYSCWMIRKEVTDKGIWFNEECWPGYMEDGFHHKAMHDAGIKAFCIDLPFLHHGSSTLKLASPRESALIRKGADENRERFRKRYGCLPGTPAYEALFA